MTAHLPPSLLALFAPRPPIPHMITEEKSQLPAYSGVSSFLQHFDPPSATDSKNISESKQQAKERKRKEKLESRQEYLNQKLEEWKPQENPKATRDPLRTLFVSRLSYDTSENKLKREFEHYGPVKRIRMVYDLEGKPRGYAFVEFEDERDMRDAYKYADGRKIDGRRILVDYEKGRTVKDWRPRRLGGGLGGTRLGGEDVNQKWSGREPPSSRSRERRSSTRSRPYDSRRDRRSRERPERRERRDRRERSRERR